MQRGLITSESILGRGIDGWRCYCQRHRSCGPSIHRRHSQSRKLHLLQNSQVHCTGTAHTLCHHSGRYHHCYHDESVKAWFSGAVVGLGHLLLHSSLGHLLLRSSLAASLESESEEDGFPVTASGNDGLPGGLFSSPTSSRSSLRRVSGWFTLPRPLPRPGADGLPAQLKRGCNSYTKFWCS